MGEILPDGSIQGYFRSCPKCGKDMEVNMQGDSMGHECKAENLPMQHVSNSVECPECMEKVEQEELDMFGGLCENC